MRVELPKSWREAADDIIVVLRRRSDPPAGAIAGLGEEKHRLVDRLVGDFLCERLVYDCEGTRLYISAAHLDAWGVSEDQCFSTGYDVLDPSCGLFQVGEGAWELRSGDGYESSRALIPGWLRAFEKQFQGVPLVLIPHARRVMVVDSSIDATLARCLAICQREFETQGNPLSPRPYCGDSAGRLEPWRPDSDHPSYQAVSASERRLSQYEYNNQRYILSDEVHGLLAEVELLRMPNSGVLRTICWWREQGPCLLAPTDFVGLETLGGERLVCTWAQLIESCAAFLQQLNWDLPRYQTDGWPDAPTIAQLRTLGVQI
jgi:hypothetical protein